MLKASKLSDVRINKYSKVFKQFGINVDFVGWNRDRAVVEKNNFGKVTYVLNGYGYSNKKLLVGYFLWLITSTLYLLRNIKNYDYIYAADFEAAFPVYLVGRFYNKISLVYDIYDEISIRYKLPYIAKSILTKIDYKIRSFSHLVIHVDSSRVSAEDENHVIVQNSPFDYFDGKFKYNKKNKLLVATGWLTEGRGIRQIYEFAKDNPDLKFAFIGIFPSKELELLVASLGNASIYPFLPQEKVFDLIQKSSGIFSLYDPSIEINRLAASNKLYDAMMLGIPIITNNGILQSSYVKENSIGVVVDYEYNNSWGDILDTIYCDIMHSDMGKKGRLIYEEKYEIRNLIKTKVIDNLM